MLDTIERDHLLERSRPLGERLMARLRDLQAKHDVIGEVRGRGMMTAIVIRCLEEGVVILKAGTYDNVIRLLPPITVEEDRLWEGLDVLDGAIAFATA